MAIICKNCRSIETNLIATSTWIAVNTANGICLGRRNLTYFAATSNTNLAISDQNKKKRIISFVPKVNVPEPLKPSVGVKAISLVNNPIHEVSARAIMTMPKSSTTTKVKNTYEI